MNVQKIISEIPYADQLGLKLVESNSQGLVFCLLPEERFIGNPVAEAFHGGVICGFMECSMSLTIMNLLKINKPPPLINQTTSFLGSASIKSPLYVQTEITKPGKRIVGAYARTYQDNKELLVAKSSSLFRLDLDSDGA